MANQIKPLFFAFLDSTSAYTSLNVESLIQRFKNESYTKNKTHPNLILPRRKNSRDTNVNPDLINMYQFLNIETDVFFCTAMAIEFEKHCRQILSINPKKFTVA